MFKGLQRPSKASAKFLNIGITRDLPIFAISVVTRGSIPVKLGGVCGPLPKTLTLFMSKIFDLPLLPYPIYARPGQTFHTLFMAVTADTVAMVLPIMMKK